MRVILLNRQTIALDKSLSFGERFSLVNNILTDHRTLIEEYWEEPKTKVMLDVLANYLYPPAGMNRVMKEELSVRKHREMNRGSHKYILFSELTDEDQKNLGLIHAYHEE